MKKIILLSYLIILLSCTTNIHKQEEVIFVPDARHILLFHPTVNNLKTFLYLTDEGIFTLPEDYRAVGVYHTSGAYDYSLSHEFLKEQEIENISLVGLEADLQPGALFTDNDLSDDFRYLFENSEGAIFFGGPDIPAAIYGEPTHLLTSVTDPHRHYLELSMLYHLLGGYQDESYKPLLEENPDYRILGICLGMQSMNVASGGTMYQDIPTELYRASTVEDVLAMPSEQQHRNYYTNLNTDSRIGPGSFHQVKITPESKLNNIAGNAKATPFILSSHHQALKKIGKGWIITATSMDEKIVEAFEHEKYPNVIGLQFHPEPPTLYSNQHQHLVPGESTGKSFMDTYPGKEGEDFHYSFWKFMGDIYK